MLYIIDNLDTKNKNGKRGGDPANNERVLKND